MSQKRKRRKTLKLKISSIWNRKRDKKSILETYFEFLKKFPKKIYILVLTLNFFIGFGILLYSHTIDYFFPHLVCLTINISITLRIGKTYFNTLKVLDEELSQKHSQKNAEIRILFKNYYAKAMNPANLIACLVVVTVFLWAIFLQHYITLNLVGCYAVFMVCISVSLSVIGYTQYIWMLWFLFRISKCSSIHYNKIVPANTPFLIEIATLLQKVKWCFLIEGFFYTFEYFILIPKESIITININMPDNFSFFLTWAIVLLVIVLAFPVLVFLQEHWLSQIVVDLKNKRIEYLSMQYEQLCMNGSVKNITFYTYMYQEIIAKIINSADYPLKIQRLGPMIVSIATVCLHMISLLSKLSSIKVFFNL